jgi:hypothetical protein
MTAKVVDTLLDDFIKLMREKNEKDATALIESMKQRLQLVEAAFPSQGPFWRYECRGCCRWNLVLTVCQWQGLYCYGRCHCAAVHASAVVGAGLPQGRLLRKQPEGMFFLAMFPFSLALMFVHTSQLARAATAYQTRASVQQSVLPTLHDVFLKFAPALGGWISQDLRASGIAAVAAAAPAAPSPAAGADGPAVCDVRRVDTDLAA